MIADFLTVFKDLGPYATLIAFFLWRDYRREDKQDRQIAVKEVQLDSAREESKKLSLNVMKITANYDKLGESTKEAVDNNTTALKRLVDVIDRLMVGLSEDHPKSKYWRDQDDNNTTPRR